MPSKLVTPPTVSRESRPLQYESSCRDPQEHYSPLDCCSLVLRTGCLTCALQGAAPGARRWPKWYGKPQPRGDVGALTDPHIAKICSR